MQFSNRHRPFKTIYLLSTLLSTLCLLPYWTVTALLPSQRPHPSWTLGRTLIIRLFRVYISTVFQTGLGIHPSGVPAPTDEEPGTANTSTPGFVSLTPIPRELLTGFVRTAAELNDVHPVRVPAYWYGNADPPPADAHVLLHLHGGGYILGRAHPSDIALPVLVRGLLSALPGAARALCPEYRLLCAPPLAPAAVNPFPAALLDALAAYAHLLAAGVPPSRIVLSGDSAGGHLAIALARYLAQSRLPELPPPGRLVLLSPTVEWVLTHTGPGSSLARCAQTTDYCLDFFQGFTARALVGTMPFDEAATNTWFSPASLVAEGVRGAFEGFPRTFISIGGAEFQADSIRTFAKRLVEDNGEANVTIVEAAGATHDYATFDWHEPERTETLEAISAWMQRE